MDKRALNILEFNKIVKVLMDLTCSELGKEMAFSLLPSNDIGNIRALLKETSDAVRFIVKKGSPPMAGIHDIRGSLKRSCMGSSLTPRELLQIADTLRASRRLKSYAKGVEVEREALLSQGNTVRELASALEINKAIEDKISFSILSEEEIADDASNTLKNIRRRIKEAQESIKEKLSSMLKSSKYQKYMQESLVTIRGDRYVIPVKQEYRNEIKGLVHDSSASGATILLSLCLL